MSGVFVNVNQPPLLTLQSQAFFVLWKEIGNRMNIKDIPETLEDLRKFNAVSEDSVVKSRNLTFL